jgi:hypothetical protein
MKSGPRLRWPAIACKAAGATRSENGADPRTPRKVVTRCSPRLCLPFPKGDRRRGKHCRKGRSVDLTNAIDATDDAAPTLKRPASGWDGVVVAGASEATTVAIPISSQKALLRRLAKHKEAAEVARVFHEAGSSRPVRLTESQRALLLSICTIWLEECADVLPEGLYAVRNALLADQRTYFRLTSTSAWPPKAKAQGRLSRAKPPVTGELLLLSTNSGEQDRLLSC